MENSLGIAMTGGEAEGDDQTLIAVEDPVCYFMWCGRAGVACCYCQREACGAGLVEDAGLERTKMIG